MDLERETCGRSTVNPHARVRCSSSAMGSCGRGLPVGGPARRRRHASPIGCLRREPSIPFGKLESRGYRGDQYAGLAREGVHRGRGCPGRRGAVRWVEITHRGFARPDWPLRRGPVNGRGLGPRLRVSSLGGARQRSVGRADRRGANARRWGCEIPSSTRASLRVHRAPLRRPITADRIDEDRSPEAGDFERPGLPPAHRAVVSRAATGWTGRPGDARMVGASGPRRRTTPVTCARRRASRPA